MAAVFIYHGLPKFYDLGATAEFMNLPLWVALLVALAEVGGGAALVVGGVWKDWMTRLGGLVLVPVMLGAIFMVHLPNGWNFMNNGVEFQVVLLAIAIYFVAVGNRKGA